MTRKSSGRGMYSENQLWYYILDSFSQPGSSDFCMYSGPSWQPMSWQRSVPTSQRPPEHTISWLAEFICLLKQGRTHNIGNCGPSQEDGDRHIIGFGLVLVSWESFQGIRALLWSGCCQKMVILKFNIYFLNRRNPFIKFFKFKYSWYATLS